VNEPLTDGAEAISAFGAKRTSIELSAMSAFDPKATSAAEFAVMHNAALIQQYASL
jgi:hypothetical protein